MKKLMRIMLLYVVFLFCIIVVNVWLFKGIPLSGIPKAENIERFIIVHSDYPDDVKEYIDEDEIKLAELLLKTFLNYAPLKRVSEDNPTIQITYIMDDGTEIVVKANDTTVWWNGKARALQKEELFVNACTGLFYTD